MGETHFFALAARFVQFTDAGQWNKKPLTFVVRPALGTGELAREDALASLEGLLWRGLILWLIVYALAIGSFGMLPLQLAAGSALPGLRTTILICLVTGLVMTLAPLALFTTALTHLPAGNASIVATVEPVVSILLAALILGQYLALPQFLGAALIIGGVVVLTTGKRVV